MSLSECCFPLIWKWFEIFLHIVCLSGIPIETYINVSGFNFCSMYKWYGLAFTFCNKPVHTYYPFIFLLALMSWCRFGISSQICTILLVLLCFFQMTLKLLWFTLNCFHLDMKHPDMVILKLIWRELAQSRYQPERNHSGSLSYRPKKVINNLISGNPVIDNWFDLFTSS